MDDPLTEPRTNGPQALPDRTLSVCAKCLERVYFRARSSVATDDPRWRIEYLVCPVCGASARRRSEVEPPRAAKTPRKKPKVVYQYDD